MAANYSSVDRINQTNPSPYGSGDPYYSQSTGYITPMSGPPAKKGLSPWIKFGVPVAIVVIVAAVVGGVVGSRNSGSSSSASSSGSGGSGGSGSGDAPATADPSAVASAKGNGGRYATATNGLYQVPLYPSTTNTALFTSPTYLTSGTDKLAWPADTFKPSSPSPTTVRPDRPRLIAPSYKWDALPNLIANDIYLKGWNDTIFKNATDYYNADPVKYFMDGGSGILDNCREVKMRIKAFGYVYHMTKNTMWVDRTWRELQNAAAFGDDDNDRWNSAHFLDVAEMTAAFAIAYDWMYDVWTADQKSTIMSTLIKYGLDFGVRAYTDTSIYFGWWKDKTYGNWNCVCNSGLTLGALAILGDDTSGVAEKILGLTIDNAKQNCVNAPSSDGTWAETADYWYFGTTGHAEMTSALQTATGSSYEMMTANKNFGLTGQYHMYAFGATSLFQWGDHGPNKYSATANAMFLYATEAEHPEYALFQREQADAAEPWSMFWYDATVAGAYWDGLALDHVFEDDLDQWASMRSSWTDFNAVYIGMKAGKLQGHATHGDLDCGDFVLDAMGVRWAGEFGSANYLSTDYFKSEDQDATRWLWYRKRTEGQNTIVVGGQNQNVQAAPSIKFDSSKTQQGSSTVFNVPSGSTAYFTADLVSAYNDTSSFKRGIRMINDRKQVLLQDEITATQSIKWIMHTNATVTTDDSGSATLELNGQKMVMQILSPSGAKFTTQNPAARSADDPALPSGDLNQDQPNPTVTAMSIELDAGTYSIQVLFNPQWSGMSSSDFHTPSSVAIDSWSLTSH